MGDSVTPLLGLFGAIAAAIGTYLGTRVTSKASVEAKKTEAAGPAWSDFTDRIMKRLDDQEQEMKDLRDKVETLQQMIDQVRRKYWQAVTGLRRVIHADASALERAALPPEVREDVVNG